MATIGIDRYRHWRPLSNAVSDAVGAAALFRRLGFEDVAPPLLDECATSDAVEALVADELTGLDANDSLIVFYAGHGGARTQRVGERDVRTGYLIPIDGDPRRVASWIELEPWLRRISKLPPRHILVILDACFSGIALSSAVKWGRDSGTALDLPFATANAKQSRLVITSALDDEQAMDCGPMPGHSLFTGCLIEALTGGLRPVGTRDGRHVTIGSELGRYVRYRVQTYPGRPGWRQTPDLGTFDFDERGEMLIPMLIGDGALAASASLARGSAERISTPPDTGPAGASWPAPTEPAATVPEIDATAIDSIAIDAAAIAAMALDAAEVPAQRAVDASPATSAEATFAAPVPAPREAAVDPAHTEPALAPPDIDAERSAPVVARPAARRRQSWIAVGVAAAAALCGAAGVLARDAPDNRAVAPRMAVPSAGSAEAAARAADAPMQPPPAPRMDTAGTEHLSAGAPVQPPASPTVSTADGHPAGGPPMHPTVGSAASGRAAASTPVPSRPSGGAAASKRAVVPNHLCRTPIESPKGAEVSWDGGVATVPTVLSLPCGVEVVLEFRSPHHLDSTKKVVATEDGKPITMRLPREIVLVDVSSTPEGATISVGRRSLGVTPATIKLPPFKASTVTFVKDGYTPVSQKFTPTEDPRPLHVDLPQLAASPGP